MSEPSGEDHVPRSTFMLIFRGGAVSRHDLSPSELQAHLEKWYRWSEELAGQGRRNTGTALDGPGATVRGRELVTDGPYAESKDLVTGSMIFEAASLEDAIEVARGLIHLAHAATGDHMSRWHLEAGIACEHAIAPSVRETGWDRIVGFYEALAEQSRSPIVALNRALAVAERDGVDEGRRELIALAEEPKLSRYPFYWAARADLERRAGRHAAAREYYEQAIALARSTAERAAFERRIESLKIS